MTIILGPGSRAFCQFAIPHIKSEILNWPLWFVLYLDARLCTGFLCWIMSDAQNITPCLYFVWCAGVLKFTTKYEYSRSCFTEIIVTFEGNTTYSKNCMYSQPLAEIDGGS